MKFNIQKNKLKIACLICVFVITFVVSLLLPISVSYADTIGLDSSLLSTYLASDESENDEIKKVCRSFYNAYITEGMSDFEKEMQIIKYLVETVKYDENELANPSRKVNDTYMAYGALVDHLAVCSGYAKAFDLLAKYCGVTTTIATGMAYNSTQNGAHAWNQIYLDDEWYNVDVTWEDPVTNLKLGFDNLLNNYINVTDDEISKDHVRETGHACTATKYGKKTVAYYLATGVVDTNPNLDLVRLTLLSQIKVFYDAGQSEEAKNLTNKLFFIGAKYDDNSNYFPDNNDLQITNYIKNQLNNGMNIIAIVTGPNSEHNISLDSGHWLDDNIDVVGRVTMQTHFHSDGENDTRILIFNFEK